MKIPVQDGSNYLRGILLLIRIDRRINEPEIKLVKRIGKSLGFESEFCENTIRNIMENKYVEATPPVFSTKELACKFIKDGFALAFSDNEGHPSEEEFLKITALKNDIDLTWFFQEEANFKDKKQSSEHLEVDDLTVVYTVQKSKI